MPSEIVDAMEQRAIFPRRLILRLISSVRMLRLYEWGFGVDSTLRRSWSVGRPARHTHTHVIRLFAFSTTSLTHVGSLGFPRDFLVGARDRLRSFERDEARSEDP